MAVPSGLEPAGSGQGGGAEGEGVAADKDAVVFEGAVQLAAAGGALLGLEFGLARFVVPSRTTSARKKTTGDGHKLLSEEFAAFSSFHHAICLPHSHLLAGYPQLLVSNPGGLDTLES